MEARLSGTTAKSVFNSKIEETVPQHQQAIGHAGIYGGNAKSKRCVFRGFLQIANEMDRQREALAPVLVLTLGTDRLLSLFELSEREGIDAAGME